MTQLDDQKNKAIFHLLAQMAKLQGPPRPGKPNKGNLNLLFDENGNLLEYVPITIAAKYHSVGRRAIEQAIRRGKLRAIGEKHHMTVLVTDLIHYHDPTIKLATSLQANIREHLPIDNMPETR